MSPMLMLAAALVVGSPDGVCRLSVDVDGEGLVFLELPFPGCRTNVTLTPLAHCQAKGFAKSEFEAIWRRITAGIGNLCERHFRLGHKLNGFLDSQCGDFFEDGAVERLAETHFY